MIKYKNSHINYPILGDNLVSCIKYMNSKYSENIGIIMINEFQYFEGVSKEVWNYNQGNHLICQSWLKMRLKKQLTDFEVDNFLNILAILTEILKKIIDLTNYSSAEELILCATFSRVNLSNSYTIFEI
jgi:hypothetical protein